MGKSKGGWPAWRRQLMAKARTEPWVFAVYWILRLIIIAAMILSVHRGDWESMFMCLLALVMLLLPTIIEEMLNIEFPSLLEIIIMLHVFAAQILGELANYYSHFPHWDLILHTVWGFLCAAIGFSLVSLLNDMDSIRFQLSPAFLALTAFCFSMTVGVIWEFFEFAMDRLFLMDMQKDTVIDVISSVALDPANSNTPVVIEGIGRAAVNGSELGLGGYLDIGLYDTMEDLFVNFIGAATFSLIGFLDIRRPGGGGLSRQLIPYPRKKLRKR